MSEPMPKWPDLPPTLGELLNAPHAIQAAQHELNCRLDHGARWMAYEQARADAAMARLRKAVEALKELQEFSIEPSLTEIADKALAEIGELPPA